MMTYFLTHDLLSPEEERELVKKAQGGDIEARNKLFAHNYRLIFDIVAKKLVSTPTSLEFNDLFDEGFIGLNEALVSYDTSRKCKFSTYATYWINNYISDAIRNDSLIKVPHWLINNLLKINNAKISLENQGLECTYEAISKELNGEFTADEIERQVRIYKRATTIKYLDAPIDETHVLYDLVGTEDQKPKSDLFEVLSNITYKTMQRARHSERDTKIILMHFGFDDNTEPVTDMEIAKQINSEYPNDKITHQRVNQIINKFLKMVRKNPATMELLASYR